ncbi:hypothetical protein [Sinisalibacter aestuarii]|uniref:Uncharacterized protein n=1 Tax=Sinisalibacter aestuarii TaxID=2949426 RepID=A0ABQ5LWZ2_9RHOB|nr:hypothetical protein [Sinisalibacter aestuarii]GKY88896.1 hypothetical protein STA1M1_27650 [Sinisalibacter aestuarii]
MLKGVVTYLAISALIFAGLVLAEARGANRDIGREMVVCSGAGMITITIGADGQPVEQVEPCPDGTSIFAASFALPELAEPAPRLLTIIHLAAAIAPAAREELSPTARGPPALA